MAVSEQDGHLCSEYDVIVAGSGVGGLSTALASAKSGLTVLVLEKDSLIGGGTAWAYGGLWAGCNHIQHELGFEDTRQATLDYMTFVAGGCEDRELLETYLDTAPLALRAFSDFGIAMRLLENFPDHYYPTAPGSVAQGRCLEPIPTSIDDLGDIGKRIRESQVEPLRASTSEFIAWGGLTNYKARNATLLAEREAGNYRAGGSALIVHLVRALKACGVVPVVDTAVAGLIRDGDRIAGVVTASGRRIRAKRGVVLATGGWEGDPELAAYFEGLPGWHSPFPKAVAGDGYRMATSVGAATALVRNNLALMAGLLVPPSDPNGEPEIRLIQILECQVPHNMIVNRDGKRFSDESYFQDTAAALREYDLWTREHRNLPCFLIFDSQYAENYSFCGVAPGAMIPQWVSRGETLKALAEKLGIDGEGLVATAARFNGFAHDGKDTDFRRGEQKWKVSDVDVAGRERKKPVGTVEKGPFYGVQLAPSAFVPSGGVKINADAQVLDSTGKVIPGLFAVGNTAAHLEYGVGYQAGYSLTAGITFGYRCAALLATQLLSPSPEGLELRT